MRRQTFVNYFVADVLRAKVRQALEADGFAVNITERVAGPALAVRVRQNTGDAERVDQLVRELAPKADKGPGSAPTVHLDGYREGL